MRYNTPPVFRFAPSPNGALHLGHAYSALINQHMAHEARGKLLLRIEDIDRQRCTPQLETNMIEDLQWLGISWEMPPRRQSDHFDDYRQALDELQAMGLIYPSFMSRGEIRATVADKKNWLHDPDGSPHYPGDERNWNDKQRRTKTTEFPQHSLRLNMSAAMELMKQPLHWEETGKGPNGETGRCNANPAAWGDPVIARSDTPTSYHISVVVDDEKQAVTHVVRGQDLFHATSLHRLLQTLLNLKAPIYHHHELVLDETGRKLSKSADDTSLRALRDSGKSPKELKQMIGF
ncbi:MAG: tRNA glutamyl-Q(34) synthetase GluQRS [Rhizobiaceae bacterium]